MSSAECRWEISWRSIDVLMLKMHCKSQKFEQKSFDDKILSKKPKKMLNLMKIYLPANFRASMMNFGWIITKKLIYDNMQMSFLAKITKISQKLLFYWNYDGFCQRNQKKQFWWDFRDFCQKAHLHIVVNCFFGCYLAKIHHRSPKIGREVYFHKI